MQFTRLGIGNPFACCIVLEFSSNVEIGKHLSGKVEIGYRRIRNAYRLNGKNGRPDWVLVRNDESITGIFRIIVFIKLIALSRIVAVIDGNVIVIRQ